MEGIVGDWILRCAQGRYFTSGEGARLFDSVHLGSKRFMRCPVDGKCGIASNADSNDLTEQELRQARNFHT